MILFGRKNKNGEYEVKDVNKTSDPTLTELKISDEENPFLNWSHAKICCYKIEVVDGRITTWSPYVPDIVIEQLDKLAVLMGNEVTNTQLALVENYEKLKTTDATIVDIQLAMVELYEMLMGGGVL